MTLCRVSHIQLQMLIKLDMASGIMGMLCSQLNFNDVAYGEHKYSRSWQRKSEQRIRIPHFHVIEDKLSRSSPERNFVFQ
ncbi:hypothetical protein Pyn_21579 [Prunus yedoensis var. nudiflora]|uniref:Uncharacterized protein n=1 Tax=Prunus yedoensis var. nudiflora TaxID=2094558 RepID=A0A314Y2D4_PRUYE|nr:hypothetical protein Pyn_21579 [Prunus yedoensis var. nudiflora]